jgi:protease-4
VFEGFKETQKPIIAIAEHLNTTEYYVASIADKILLDPMGSIQLTGFRMQNLYINDLLQKAKINVQTFKVGNYKSAAEPLIRNNMSEESKRANEYVLDDLWNSFITDIHIHRPLIKTNLTDLINNQEKHLKTTNGNTAAFAIQTGLVDQLLTRQEKQSIFLDLFGENETSDTFNQIHFQDYNDYIDTNFMHISNNEIGVIIAQGQIVGGNQPPGNIGAKTLTELIISARKNDNIKAIVIRVDSGGGSAFASEIIHREIQETIDSGKPVVISMSSTAASGGHWMSAKASEIWSTPTTITGSIGFRLDGYLVLLGYLLG